MSIKYKIDDAKKNKNLINDEIKSKDGHGDRTQKEKQKSTKTLLIEFMGEQRAFNKQQLKFNTWIEKQVSNLRKDVSNLSNRFDNLVEVNNLKE